METKVYQVGNVLIKFKIEKTNVYKEAPYNVQVWTNLATTKGEPFSYVGIGRFCKDLEEVGFFKSEVLQSYRDEIINEK